MNSQLTWINVGTDEPFDAGDPPNDAQINAMAAQILRESSTFTVEDVDGRFFVRAEMWRGCGQYSLWWNQIPVSDVTVVWDMRRAADRWADVLKAHKLCPGPEKPPKRPPRVPFVAELYSREWGKVPLEKVIAISEVSGALAHAMLRLAKADLN